MPLTYANLETEVYLQAGLSSADQTKVDQWLDITQSDIYSRWPWSFSRNRESVVTVVDKTAGTVSVNAAGTTVTGVSTAFASSDVGSFIQFQGENDWYKIATVTPTTTLTISTAYAQIANLSAGTYIIRKFFYSLSSSADKIIDIRSWNQPCKLVQVDARSMDSVVPLMPATGASYGYVAWGLDSSGNIQFTPYPFPSSPQLFEVRTVIRPTAGALNLPNKYAQNMAYGAIALAFAFLRKKEEAILWNQKYEAAIKTMKMTDRSTEDYQPMLQPIEGLQGATFQTLPGSYPILP